MKQTFSPTIEPLESRIAPAIIIANPIFDIKGGAGQTSADIDLAKLVDPSTSYRTIVEFVTNFTKSGASSPSVIRLELFDDKTPLTVQNFLSYVNNTDLNNDYDGTYFHRLVSGFVLQGGGYNPPISINNFGTHVETPLTVHNEFFADDTTLDPVVGTIAMAKVGTSAGGGPHSATSEFFINYADNSGILDDQNGGFTVFGRVIQGMDAVTEMANLRKVAISNLVGPGGSEGIPTTASGVPTSDQLIKIVDARVITPTAGNPAGHTFSVEVLDNATGLQSSALITQSIDASNNLKLTYKAGATGVAKVKVSVSKPGEDTVVDEFTVTVLPNLISEVENNIGTLVVPGQKGIVNVNLINNGAGIAKGDIKVRLFLSEITSGNSDIASGFTLEESGADRDIEITADVAKKISIVGGKSFSLPVKYEISPDVAKTLKLDGNYRLLAKIETPDGSSIQELFTDDNVGNIRDAHQFKNAFGNLEPGRSGVKITLPENSTAETSDALTLILKGPGIGEATRNADGSLNVSVSGTTSASSFSIKTASGAVADISQLHITNAIGALKLANVHLISHFSASGGVKSIILGDLGALVPTESSNFDIGGASGAKTTLKFGTVRDFTFDSTVPVKSLTAKAWLNVNTAEREALTFNGLGKLSIGGNFEASLTERSTSGVALISVTGDISGGTFSTKAAVKKLVGGNVTGATFNLGDSAQISALSKSKGTIAFKNVIDSSVDASYPITSLTALAWGNTQNSAVESLKFQGLGTLKIAGDLGADVTERSGLTVTGIAVAGAIRNSIIQSKGDIASLSVGTLDGVNVFAGVTAKPTQLSDLANARNIGSILVKTAFVNSNVVGSELGKVAVAGVNGDSGLAKVGFYADAIKSYVRTGGPKLSNLLTPAPNDEAYDTQGANYEVRVY